MSGSSQITGSDLGLPHAKRSALQRPCPAQRKQQRHERKQKYLRDRLSTYSAFTVAWARTGNSRPTMMQSPPRRDQPSVSKDCYYAAVRVSCHAAADENRPVITSFPASFPEP